MITITNQQGSLLFVCSIVFCFAPTVAICAEAMPAITSPITSVAVIELEHGIAVAADHAFRSLKSRHLIRLTGFPLRADRHVELELEQFYVTSPATQFAAGTVVGDVPLQHPNVALFQGHVRGDDQSTVFLGLSPVVCNGFITVGDEEYILAPRQWRRRSYHL